MVRPVASTSVRSALRNRCSNAKDRTRSGNEGFHTERLIDSGAGLWPIDGSDSSRAFGPEAEFQVDKKDS